MSQTNAEKAIQIIENQITKLKSFQPPYDDHVPQWKDRTIRMLTNLVVEEELNLFADIERGTWEQEVVAYAKSLFEISQGIQETPEFFLIQHQLDIPVKAKKKTNIKPGNTISNKVFVVHGHDSLTKTEVARTLEKLGLEAIILHEQANEGKTIIEKFERDASQVSFAVILLTSDDIGYPKNKEKEAKPRARQNVVLELGYFSGILGRSNVCVLHKAGVEIPSDYLGVIYIPLDKEDAWKYKLSKELKKANLDVDLNKLV